MDEINCKWEIHELRKKKKGTNLKELPRSYYLAQNPSTKHVQGGVQVSKTSLPSVGLLSLPKVTKEGQLPQGYYLTFVCKKICP